MFHTLMKSLLVLPEAHVVGQLTPELFGNSNLWGGHVRMCKYVGGTLTLSRWNNKLIPLHAYITPIVVWYVIPPAWRLEQVEAPKPPGIFHVSFYTLWGCHICQHLESCPVEWMFYQLLLPELYQKTTVGPMVHGTCTQASHKLDQSIRWCFVRMYMFSSLSSVSVSDITSITHSVLGSCTIFRLCM